MEDSERSMARTPCDLIHIARMPTFRPAQGYLGMEVAAGPVRRLKAGGLHDMLSDPGLDDCRDGCSACLLWLSLLQRSVPNLEVLAGNKNLPD